MTVTVAFRIEAQRAELHLDLPDALLTDLAVHAVQPVEQEARR